MAVQHLSHLSDDTKRRFLNQSPPLPEARTLRAVPPSLRRDRLYRGERALQGRRAERLECVVHARTTTRTGSPERPTTRD